MQSMDMFNAATAPLTFHDFLQRMRHPSAADLVRSIKSFIVSFSKNSPDPERDSKSVQEFYSTLEEAFRTHPLWAGATEDELDSSCEGLEKYLMTKLFNHAFALRADAKKDQELSEKMSLVKTFIQPEHLDIHINFQHESSWLIAQKELQKINTYKSPRDKLVCILNYCKVISNLLLNASMATNDNPPGADVFLPVLIYVTIKANPPQLHSNLMYIQRYRRQSRLVSEAAYFFTNLVSAESFISNIDAKSLSMEEDEFEKKMQQAKLAVNAAGTGILDNSDNLSDSPVLQSNSDSLSSLIDIQKQLQKENAKASPLLMQGDQANRAPKKHKSVHFEKIELGNNTRSPTEESKISVQKLQDIGSKAVLQADQTGELIREYPFLYANSSDLSVADVDLLLIAYKELVLKYVSLSKGVESSFPLTNKPEIKEDKSSERLNLEGLQQEDLKYQQMFTDFNLLTMQETKEESQTHDMTTKPENITIDDSQPAVTSDHLESLFSSELDSSGANDEELKTDAINSNCVTEDLQSGLSSDNLLSSDESNMDVKESQSDMLNASEEPMEIKVSERNDNTDEQSSVASVDLSQSALPFQKDSDVKLI